MGGKLRNVARFDYYTHPQALPRFGQNTEGTHERAAERSAVDKGIGTGYNQGRTGHSKPTPANHHKALQHLCRGIRTVRHRPHRSNRPIPNYVTTRLLVHHGRHPSRHKLHFLQINEELNQRQYDHSLPKNGRQDEALCIWAKTSPLGQQVFGSIQSMHCKEWDDPRTSSPGLPLSQHRQIGHPNIQEQFPIYPQWSGG